MGPEHLLRVRGLLVPKRRLLTTEDNAADRTSGIVAFKAAFPNADESLWPGQFVDVTVRLTEARRCDNKPPAAAVFEAYLVRLRSADLLIRKIVKRTARPARKSAMVPGSGVASESARASWPLSVFFSVRSSIFHCAVFSTTM